MTTQPDPPPRAVTRADVARLAGVSTAVVSYVVNNGPKPVASPTAARVREAIALLGYRPNVSARALKTGTTHMLGLVISDSTNPFFAEFGLAIELAAAERGYAVLMANSQAKAETERRLIEQLISRGVDGLLVGSVLPHPEWPSGLRRTAPAVWIDRSLPVPGWPSLGVDSVQGTALAVDHLIEVHGHTSVGLLIGDDPYAEVDRREQGWEAALRRHGLPNGPIARAPFSREGGYSGGGRLLELPDRPRAIFASSDLQAVGLLRAAHERGVAVPGDLAVVSFDGTQESAFCWPPLTAVEQPVSAMAAAAVATVLSEGGSGGSAAGHQRFGMELITRRSCGCGRTVAQTRKSRATTARNGGPRAARSPRSTVTRGSA